MGINHNSPTLSNKQSTAEEVSYQPNCEQWTRGRQGRGYHIGEEMCEMLPSPNQQAAVKKYHGTVVYRKYSTIQYQVGGIV